MRKFLISLLLASAAASPALAAPGDNADRDQAKAERQEARSERQQQQRSDRAERSERSERPAESVDRTNDAQPRSQSSVVRPSIETARPARETGRGTIEPVAPPKIDRVTRINRSEGMRATSDARRNSTNTVRNVPTDERERVTRRRASDGPKIVTAPEGGESLRQSERPLPRVLRNRVPVVSSVPREGTQPPLRAERRRTDQVRWSSSHWRSDRRYNWQDWRRRHRSHFHLGIYYDPFGWGYRPYSIGWRLWPSYYNSSRYWLNDPWSYRLPYAPPGYRWIRYYDDAVLVDTWTGEVVDVIHNFFW